MYISVVGASECGEGLMRIAYEVGAEVARHGHVLVCGGLAGVMEAAAHGARDAGGVSIGILPGAERSQANKWLTVSIPTDLGHARNAVVALSADALIAVGGGYGTLSEVAFGLKMHKPVVGMETWDLGECAQEDYWIARAKTPADAVRLAEELVRTGYPNRPDEGVS